NVAGSTASDERSRITMGGAFGAGPLLPYICCLDYLCEWVRGHLWPSAQQMFDSLLPERAEVFNRRDPCEHAVAKRHEASKLIGKLLLTGQEHLFELIDYIRIKHTSQHFL